jgi:hypothetical protein
MSEPASVPHLPAVREEYDRLVRLERPSRRILVEVLVPTEPVTTEPAVAKEPEGEPQPLRS